MKYSIEMKPGYIYTQHAAILRPLTEVKDRVALGDGWLAIKKAEELIVNQERAIWGLADIANYQARMVRRSGPTYRATYTGPIKAWYGQTALLRDITVAQFDDRGHYMAHGWTAVRKEDFVPVEPRKVPLYEALATACQARKNSEGKENQVSPYNPWTWHREWTIRLTDMVKKHMPSGSGFDAGTYLDLDESSANRLVFTTSFHHMDQHGGYDGWTEHQVIITPSLSNGFNIRVTGRNKNDIKDHIHDVFGAALLQEVSKYGG